MTHKKRYRYPLLFVLCSSFTGCDSPPPDFIEADGTYANGKIFHLSRDFKRHYCDRDKNPGCIVMEGRVLHPDPGDPAIGLRLEYLPDQMQGQTTFSSGLLPLRAVSLAVIIAGTTTAGTRVETYATIEGGQIEFTSLGTAARQITAGTFRNMNLVSETTLQTLLSIPSGKFQYYFPETTSFTGGTPLPPDLGPAPQTPDAATP